ncbi:MAG: DUF423 domain-containing protein [Rhodospirillaceae bacterium]|jgi:uncharacterized membrane protein YgdD (TMEM256/DUF423 family)|nr:DUF423 domain-containing protein [Rhodospirillaceae bacterium]MBT5242253.1 DUF423 domain-containing protein [Rhodospirillaceae bacterium]MBT5565981.1 DUF423 domain-containing protein [Rhodospirillaceae bacterium]MBT6088599.1 DUF423 domain-containing protein [Rhodospirillaceae bacterium]MBT6960306.1 DUF423 domain-containing protein [Rhodospirillaceae bacterium]
MYLSRTAIYLIVFAALNGLVAVITGSLAAHGIEAMAPAGEQAVSWFYDGSDFQMKMAIGIVLVALLHDRVAEGRPRKLMLAAGVLFGIGILCFSGALYSLSFNGPGIFAPFGGLAAMIGFICLTIGAISSGAKSLERGASE